MNLHRFSRWLTIKQMHHCLRFCLLVVISLVGVLSYPIDSFAQIDAQLDSTPQVLSQPVSSQTESSQQISEVGSQDTKAMKSMADPQSVFDYHLWNKLLKRFVTVTENGGSTAVDYAGIKKHEDVLQSFLNQMSQVELKQFNQWGKSDQLAFLINAYNAFTLKLIIDNYPGIESIKELGGFFSSPWQLEFVPLLGEQRSLDNIEHELIRDDFRYQEARIHFAVNCASVGCPALRSEAYTGEQLDQQLEQQTKQFLSDRTRNYADGNKLFLSQIFDWYEEDFEKGWNQSSSLEQFIARYAAALKLSSNQQQTLLNGQMDIEFLSYDWQLNK